VITMTNVKRRPILISVFYEQKVVYLSAISVIALFFSDSPKLQLYTFHVEISSVLMYALVISLMIIHVMTRQKYYLDVVTFMLALRLIVGLIPLLSTGSFEYFWGNFFAGVASLLSYMFFSQRHTRDIAKGVNKVIILLLCVLSLQIIYVSLLLRIQFEFMSINLWKYYMVVPIGASNYVASVILLLMVFVYFADINWKMKISVILLGLIAMLLIFSRSAILLLVLFGCSRFCIAYFRGMKKMKGISNAITPLLLVTMLILLASVMGGYFLFNYLAVRGDMGMAFNPLSLFERINALTSNRLILFSLELERWTDHIFFGGGFSGVTMVSRSHNWIIDLLVRSGVVGLVIFLVAIGGWYQKVARCSCKSPLIRSTFYASIVALIQGMLEVTLFTVTFDILFWTLVGLSIAEVNYAEGVRRALTRLSNPQQVPVGNLGKKENFLWQNRNNRAPVEDSV